ncbi:MAG: DUF2723 domain-containing protein [Candidatus Eremiobacteraeota bacterium]|nr:DUF2723 domain-containing protein [Candidatus Eremiobacteraeota bacterium]
MARTQKVFAVRARGPFRRLKTLLGLAAFVIPLAVYLASLDGDVAFWDTAEMNTVPYMLGIAHPNGFPSETLLGWIFSHAVAFGEVSFRLAVLNALEVAGAAALAYAFVIAETGSALLGLFSALGFALSPVVWQHANHTDDFGLTVLLSAAVVLLVRRWWCGGDGRAVLIAAALAGLAAGTHGAVVFFVAAPAAVAIVLALRRSPMLAAASIAIFALVALAVYAYLPLRSSYVVAHRLDPTLAVGLPPGRPFWDWGDPRTASGFVRLVTGWQFSAPDALRAYARPSLFVAAVGFGLRALREAAGLPFLIFVLALSAASGVRYWALTLYLLAPTALVTPFVASFSAEPDPTRYYMFPLWGLWTAAALGVDALLHRFSWPQRTLTGALACAILALTLSEIYAGRALFVQRSDRLGFNYLDALTSQTPANSIVVAPWQYATPIAYALYVQERMTSSILAPGEADEMADRIPQWLTKYNVVAISEQHPVSNVFVAKYVCNFNVLPGSSHDPKLYRILPPGRSVEPVARSMTLCANQTPLSAKRR